MALSFSTKTGLLIHGLIGEAHYADLMKQWRGFDALIQASVKDRDLATPPGSPTDGSCYIVAGSPTGAWVGNTGKIARWSTQANAWEFYTPKEGWNAWVDDEDLFLVYNGSSWVTLSSLILGGSAVQCIPVACSDETTALTAGVGKVTFRMPYGFSLTEIRASLTTAQGSGSIFTVDVNLNGTSILSTKLTIDNTEKTSKTAVTAPVISTSALTDDGEITIDIDQVGDGTAKGLKVYLIGVKT